MNQQSSIEEGCQTDQVEEQPFGEGPIAPLPGQKGDGQQDYGEKGEQQNQDAQGLYRGVIAGETKVIGYGTGIEDIVVDIGY